MIGRIFRGVSWRAFVADHHDAAARKHDAASRARDAVARCFGVALALIGGGGRGSRWRGRGASRLPWYVVMGAAGGGKTALIEAAGLRFSHETALAAALETEAPFRWRLADEAVLIEASPSGDDARAQWDAFTRRLKRARRRDSLNGVIAVVDASRLAEGDEASVQALAASLRERLDAMARVLSAQPPVYMVLTQCDRLAGFEPFFAQLDDDARGQLWGVTFDPHATDTSWLPAFRGGFAALVHRLQACTFDRLPLDGDTQRGAAILGFPPRFAALGDATARFLEAAFGASPYAPSAFVRGVHFTAARLAGEQRAEYARAQGHFIAQWLREFVFREASLAGSRPVWPRRRTMASRMAVVAMVLAALAFAACMLASHARNRAQIDATASASRAVAELARHGVMADDPVSMLPLLGAARNLPGGYAQREMPPALLARFGLDRRAWLGELARARYRALLARTVQPFVVARIEHVLRADDADAASRYTALRVYLMLGSRAHYDAVTVLAWQREDAHALALTDAQRADWLAHVAAWLDPATFEADVPLDKPLIDSARAQLARSPLSERVFETILPQLEAALPEPLSVARMAGDEAALVFFRRSGKPMTEGVPGAYTPDGYRRYLALRCAALAHISSEDWVTKGSLAYTDATSREALSRAVDRYYFQRYVAAWDGLLDDVALRALPKPDDGAAVVKLLAGDDSPLRRFLQAAARETTLEQAGGSGDSTQASSGVMTRLMRQIRVVFAGEARRPMAETGTAAPAEPRATPVDHHFEALHHLVASTGGGKSSLDQIQAALDEAGVFLDAVNAAHASGLPAPPGDALDKLRQAAVGTPAPLPAMLQGLSASGKTLALQGERKRLDTLWRAGVAPFCHVAIDGRYPFVKTSAVDVTIDDFARLLGPGGLIDAFFSADLQPYVDMGTMPWRWRRSAASLGMSRATLDFFMQAVALRDAFFANGGKKVDVRFTLTPKSMDPALTRFVLTSGASTLDYAHDPPRGIAFSWPGGEVAATARIDYAPASADGQDALEANGPWALFRLIDQGRLKAERADGFDLSFDLGGRDVDLALAASSVRNPFALARLRRFICIDHL